MVTVDDNEQSDQAAGSRAGGNVETKGASKAPTSETDSGTTRAGGNVETKGASRDKPTSSSTGPTD